MTDPITIARAQVAIENGLIEALQSQTQADMDGTTVIVSRQACDEAAEFLPALYDEVKRLRAERDAGKRTAPAGQTPLDDKLNHRFLDVIREGEAARDAGTASPYHGHSLEHCLHATGWVSRDLRLALDEACARAEKAEAERIAEWNKRRDAESSLVLEKAVCLTAEAERDRLRAALNEIATAASGIANEIHIGPEDEGRDLYEMALAIRDDASAALKGPEE